MEYILTRLSVDTHDVEIIDVSNYSTEDEQQDAYLKAYNSMILDIDEINDGNMIYDVLYRSKTRTELYLRINGWVTNSKTLTYCYIISLYEEE